MKYAVIWLNYTEGGAVFSALNNMVTYDYYI